MPDSTLRLCPLCKGGVTIEEIQSHTHKLATFMPDHPGSWAIECHPCGIGLIRDTRNEAITARNTRAADAEIERLRAENEALKRVELCANLMGQFWPTIIRALRESDPNNERVVSNAASRLLGAISARAALASSDGEKPNADPR